MLNDKIKLSGLVGDIDDLGRITRNLVQAVHDHGGDVSDLNRLLLQVNGALGANTLFAQMAKVVVGEIWSLTENGIELGLLDFDQSSLDFLSAYPKVAMLPGNCDFGGNVRFNEMPLRRPCKHQLEHLSTRLERRELLFDEVLYAHRYSQVRQHAGWRELVAYTDDSLTPEILGNRKVIAAGSRIQTAQRLGGEEVPSEATIFPALMVQGGQIVIGWMGPDHGDQRTTYRFGPECFYLTRVYQPRPR